MKLFTVSVIFVTTLSTAIVRRCWRQNHYVGDFFNVKNRPNLSPTSSPIKYTSYFQNLLKWTQIVKNLDKMSKKIEEKNAKKSN